MWVGKAWVEEILSGLKRYFLEWTVLESSGKDAVLD